MEHTIHFPILKSLGLTEGESLIYELLLESGTSEARELVIKSGIGRGNVYNILMQLRTKGLVLTIESKKQRFQAVDPAKLRSLMEAKLNEAKQLENEFSSALPQLLSAFNLSTGRPAIQIFEGIEGAKRALYESLQSKTEILTYVDISSLAGPMAKINKEYVKKRIEKKIPKRIIVSDTREAHEFFDAQNTPYTRVAFVQSYPERHASAMEIYDGTVTYLTLTNEKRISLLVSDPSIYEMHKEQFNFLWNLATRREDYDSTSGSNTA